MLGYLEFGEYLKFVCGWGVCLTGGILLSRSVTAFLPGRSGHVWRIAPVILFGIVLGMPTWVADGNPLYYLPFHLLVFALCYQESLSARLVTGMIFYDWIIGWSMLVDTRAVLPGTRTVWGALLWKFLMWVAVSVFIRRLTKDRTAIHLPIRIWISLGLVAAAVLMSILAFSIWDIRRYTSSTVDGLLDAIGYTMLPFHMAASLALLGGIVLLSRHEGLEREHQLSEMRTVYYAGIRREAQQIRQLRHDLRNHLTAVRGLIEQSADERAMQYLDDLCGSAALSGGSRICENETANAVLVSKRAELERIGLTADLAVSLPDTLSIADADLCCLLGNALDNAMEAAQTASDKHVRVRCRTDKGLFMLEVENKTGGTISPDLSTTKTDRRAHGFGLPGIREIAARYGGTMDVQIRDDRFTLIVCFPLSE